jgi:lipopolysaccharide export system protein LptA
MCSNLNFQLSAALARRLSSIAAALSILLASYNAMSLPEDWEQTMVIQSDRAELDRKTGMVIYEGDVELTQGTLKIQSDRLMAIMDGNHLKQAVAEGSPARYEQQVTPERPITRATASRIDFYSDSREVTFQGNATLTQEDNLFSGEHIRYELENERVTASGQLPNASPSEPGSEGENERIRVIIQPQPAAPVPLSTSEAAPSPSATEPEKGEL